MERARKRTKTDTDEKGHILAPDVSVLSRSGLVTVLSALLAEKLAKYQRDTRSVQDEVGLLKVQNATLAGEVRSLKEYAREVELKLRAYQSAADHGQLVASKYEQCWREVRKCSLPSLALAGASLEASLSDLLLRSGQTDLAKVANANNEQLMSAVADFVDTVCEKKQDYLRALVGKIKREAGDEESGEETVEAGSPFTVALDSILAGMRERQKETARLVETLLTVTSTGTSAGPGADAIVRVAQGKLAAENALSACKEAISNVSRTNDRLKLELDDCRDEAAQLRRSLHVARTRGGVSIKKEHPANEQANASAAPAASKQAAPDPSTLVTKEEELSLILEKTRNELACSEEARGKLEAEIIRLNGTYLSPGFILQSEIVTNLKRENESLLRQHTNLVDSYNDMRRQLEDLQVQHAATLMKKDNIELLREQLTHSKSQMAAAESLMEKERQDNREAQTTLQTRISTMERQHGTAEALRKMVSSLEAENGRLKGEVDKLKVDRADLELQFNVRGERLTRLEAEVAMATVMSTGAAALRQERDIALERVGELEVFVQVLREANPQPLDLIEAAGQVRRLRGEVDTLRAGTETADAREKLAKALQEVDASRDMVSAKEKERAAAHAEATQLKSLLDEKEGALRAKDQEFNSICSEIDTIGGLYERQKEQNMGLLHQLAERDEQNTQLLSERIRFQQEKMGQSEDMRLFETKLNQVHEMRQGSSQLGCMRSKAAIA
eukprot:scaffold302_cov397-Prasinococcus_capsulatus_cf.AAC.22